MEKKIAVYICTGCGIGEALDIDALSKVATGEYKTPICKNHGFLCGQEGVELIKNDIEAEGANTIVIAGCSTRINYDVFNFGPDKIVERCNLREQVIWCHPADDEDTQMLAEDNLRMALVKQKNMNLPEPYQVENMSKTVLVVGGGFSGLTAALESAKAGYQTVLVEKEAALGGYVGKMYKQVPMKAPFTELEENSIPALIKAVEDAGVKVYTSATLENTAGAPGMFDVTINQNGSTVEERVGAIVLATGAKPYDAEKLGHLGYGKYENVITQAQLEEMAVAGKLEASKVAFIQCAGSRDQEHLPYCSAACCIESMKQALIVKEKNPEANVYVYFKDIRSNGQYEHFYKKAQQEGVIFIKGDVTEITESDGTLTITADDHTMGTQSEADEFDLVVLANGMVPSAALGDVVEEPAQDEAAAAAEEPKVQAPAIIKSNLLNLAYRQGPELPELKYGFPDSHYICFPYETRRTGIYAAGVVRAPMDMLYAQEDAVGAALKAIQCIEATAVGQAVHPRSGDMSFPEFNMTRCTQCKRCTEECPFGAINEDEKANPLPNPSRCRRCGTCMGACPERIISFKNYSVPMIGNMVKAIEVPEEADEKPRILIFACENDAIPALDMAGMNHLEYNSWVRIIPVRCLGSLNLIWINDAMAKGFDGVLLMGCKHGDDYQCHFMKGSELAEIRLSKISETLNRLGLESERVRATTVNIMDYDKIPAMLDEFAAELEELGPNPMKDFQ
ncbi:putative adenylylsulfate reductase-associated electron transfer protein QmoB [Desulfotomaculum arcticum]|uniref:Putative adenylylsulfate reductase-associated electron transfer protein QmoB n=1 Tax=Desulfotruncus arcticus DSM 17038 TaxID=1121424 RepID=A0A1I2QM21_9FIRM|nr:hydrogenase iron-sulfur subunit [Desulfotruncus arcticus]SFG26736.1 putative adenylylsulfate reductase-associated electron transfer protein QmoB [Desulfotomaculum arcticum] [Desulfotruncus arcticus DSM 17038]